MEPDSELNVELSPQQHVFRLEELLSTILEYLSPSASKNELLGLRTLGRTWRNCSNRLFKEPPLVVHLQEDGIENMRNLCRPQDLLLPITVSIFPPFSPKTLPFLTEYSNNIEVLLLHADFDQVVDGLQSLTVPKLKKIMVFAGCNAFLPAGHRIYKWPHTVAANAPKLEYFKIYYNGMYEFNEKLEDCRLPDLLTHLKAERVSAHSLHRDLERSNVSKLSMAEINIASGEISLNDINQLVKHYFVNLKKLHLFMDYRVIGSLKIYKLEHLEDFYANVPFEPYNSIIPLSACLPKLSKLNMEPVSVTSLHSFITNASKYENLRSLELGGLSVNYEGVDEGEEEEYFQQREAGVIRMVREVGFPAMPNLESLTWEEFTNEITHFVVTKVFASAPYISHLRLNGYDLLDFCDHYLNHENNSLGGTNFSRLTKLTITSSSEFTEKFYGPISIIMFHLKMIELRGGMRVRKCVKSAWEASGREMMVEPKFILE